MKERPILFSAPMVNAILEGRKTQTRRIVKKQDGMTAEDIAFLNRALGDGSIASPYGVPGDELWVRETWGIHSKSWTYYGWEYDGLIEFSTRTPREDLICNSSHKIRQVAYAAHGYEPCREGGEAGWKPSIHMPRWASRISLVVKSVRVERLQDISPEDVEAEGIQMPPSELYPNVNRGSKLKRHFQDLWESINGEGSWDENPYVWVIEFEVKK